ncbi:MAG: dimethylarginine dimethylaminohydrolase family protein [Sarcina sp.]
MRAVNIQIRNRYDKLKEVIMCYPTKYGESKTNIDYKLMFEQYNNFLKILTEYGVKIYFLNPSFGENQVYTRDIGFVIDDIFFISKMSMIERKKETIALKEFLKKEKINIHIYEMKNNIEGGDVIIHENRVFIGLSTRTSLDAIKELENYLNIHKKDMKIIPIRFNSEKMLHLDCVFNVLNDNSCLLSEYIYDKTKIENHFENYYYINNDISLELGVNIVCMENNIVISSCKKISHILEERGVTVIYSDYSEIVKGGGSFTCSTLPIYS